jgi:hypothetical protein
VKFKWRSGLSHLVRVSFLRFPTLTPLTYDVPEGRIADELLHNTVEWDNGQSISGVGTVCTWMKEL